MLRRTPLTPKRTNRRNIRLEPLLLGTIRPRRQLDKRMQRHLHPRTLLLRHIHIIRINTPQHSLMRHNYDILAALQLHNDRLQPNDDVAVGFAAAVAVVVLVVVAGAEIFRVTVRDFLIGEAVADARVELVEGFPFEFGVAGGRSGEEARGLDGAFEGGGPDCELAVVADGAGDEFGEGFGVEFASFGDVGVAADLTVEVEFGFAVLVEEVSGSGLSGRGMGYVPVIARWSGVGCGGSLGSIRRGFGGNLLFD